jgi:hypothetical protein
MQNTRARIFQGRLVRRSCGLKAAARKTGKHHTVGEWEVIIAVVEISRLTKQDNPIVRFF